MRKIRLKEQRKILLRSIYFFIFNKNSKITSNLYVFTFLENTFNI